MSKYTLKAGKTALKWPKFAIDYFMTRPKYERTLVLEKPDPTGDGTVDVHSIAAFITDIRQDGDEFVMDIDTKDTQSGHVLNNILSTGELVTTLKGGTFLFLCIFMLFQSATF